eukprot:CAMPEP_0201249880 /NCGR_PEP_ID=MMETSP0852-20130820/61441_1 /ASSEMBLY_ACC=CAM_ASM_000632 /TAXON_ID=183588 /ORGANISM="Pseudo-nitzschia fraudulenta, Strain WWA7" /LENGTH=92 /DNA_ID=CAMNT_0047549045 /DNA_START=81 /DNA_END=356 /DNA_ORIENTATION=+
MRKLGGSDRTKRKNAPAFVKVSTRILVGVLVLFVFFYLAILFSFMKIDNDTERLMKQSQTVGHRESANDVEKTLESRFSHDDDGKISIGVAS